MARQIILIVLGSLLVVAEGRADDVARRASVPFETEPSATAEFFVFCHDTPRLTTIFRAHVFARTTRNRRGNRQTLRVS